MLIELLLAISLIILGISLLFFVPLAFGAPFEPSRKKAVKTIIDLSDFKQGDKVVDLGSGDGRIVIEFAKRGAEAHGYELNPWLVIYSKYKIYKEGLRKKAFVHWRSFWNVNLANFDIVVSFQIGYIMNRLEKKLKRELKPKSKVVSNMWKFKNWKIYKEKNNVRVYLMSDS